MRALRINAIADEIEQLEAIAQSLDAAAIDIPKLRRQTLQILPIFANVLETVGSERGAQMVVAGAVAELVSLGGWPAVTAYTLSMAAWHGKEAFIEAVRATAAQTKRRNTKSKRKSLHEGQEHDICPFCATVLSSDHGASPLQGDLRGNVAVGSYPDSSAALESGCCSGHDCSASKWMSRIYHRERPTPPSGLERWSLATASCWLRPSGRGSRQWARLARNPCRRGGAWRRSGDRCLSAFLEDIFVLTVPDGQGSLAAP